MNDPEFLEHLADEIVRHFGMDWMVEHVVRLREMADQMRAAAACEDL